MLPHVQRQKNKDRRKRDVARQEREERDRRLSMLPSKTSQKKQAREERAKNERAERKLQKLDARWGLGLGPIKARLKWMRDLLG